MYLSGLEFSIAAGLIFFGAVVQGSIGFGLGVVAAPFLLLIHADFVPGPIIFFAAISAALNLWSYRTHIALNELFIALIARVPGTLLAMAVLLVASVATLSILLGLSVLTTVAISLCMPVIERTKKLMFIAGFMSAFMGTTTAIGGPPIALAYQSATGPGARANISAYMLIGMIMSLFGLLVIGQFDLAQITLSLLMIPVIVLGFLVSRNIAPRINPRRLRTSVLVICTIAGVTALGKGLHDFLPINYME